MDSTSIQKRMLEIQGNESQIQELFGKLVSGKSGYKAVIEKSKPIEKCSCGKVLEGDEKFCPECGRAISVEKK